MILLSPVLSKKKSIDNKESSGYIKISTLFSVLSIVVVFTPDTKLSDSTEKFHVPFGRTISNAPPSLD